MKAQLIRHATCVLTYRGKNLLLDPMLSDAGTLAPVVNSPNSQPNPLVEIPQSALDLAAMEAVLLTHTHRDHFDDAAAKRIPKHIPVFCQPEDERKLLELGFLAVMPVHETVRWSGFCIMRTGGRHGHGEIGEKMGPVAGYVLQADDEPCLYIAGDTVWCPEVGAALTAYQPEYILLFGGEARFNEGRPITMGSRDIYEVATRARLAKLAVVHMEAFNHCLLRRDELQAFLQERGLLKQVCIPKDGAFFFDI